MFKNFSFKKQPKATIASKILTKPVMIAIAGGLGCLLLGKLARKLTAPANPHKMAVVIIDKKNPCDGCTEECDSRIPSEGATEGSNRDKFEHVVFQGMSSEELAAQLLENALNRVKTDSEGEPAHEPEPNNTDSVASAPAPAEAEVNSPEPEKGTEERNQGATNGNAHGNGRKHHRDK